MNDELAPWWPSRDDDAPAISPGPPPDPAASPHTPVAPDAFADTLALPHPISPAMADPGGSPLPPRRNRRRNPAPAPSPWPSTTWLRSPWTWAAGGSAALALIGWTVVATWSGSGSATAADGPGATSPVTVGTAPAGTPSAPGSGGPESPGPADPTTPPTPARTGGRASQGNATAWIASPVIGVQSDKCLHVAGGSATDQARIELATCDEGAAQAIAHTPAGELRVLGRCLDAKEGGTGNGTPVIIYSCNGQQNQKWTLASDGTIRGVQSGLCLDATDFGTADGTPLQLWTCTGGRNQAWTS